MTAWDVKYLTGQDIKGWATETFCNNYALVRLLQQENVMT